MFPWQSTISSTNSGTNREQNIAISFQEIARLTSQIPDG
jgi:hypothetical protein